MKNTHKWIKNWWAEVHTVGKSLLEVPQNVLQALQVGHADWQILRELLFESRLVPVFREVCVRDRIEVRLVPETENFFIFIQYQDG